MKYSFILLILSFTTSFSQGLFFDKIGKKDGLPDNNIFSIAQDKYGHLWFGTTSGLALYNGYSFHTWRHQHENPYSLPHNEVNFLLATTHNELYVGNISKGIYKFDYRHEKFYPLDKTAPVKDKKWFCLFPDKMGVLWIGSTDGLSYYDTTSQSIVNVDLGIKEKYFISSIDQDEKGNLWMFASGNNILKYDPRTKGLEVIPYFKGEDKWLLTRGGRVLYDATGYVWIGTEFEGLFRYNIATKQIDRFATSNGKLTSNIILSILKDKKGRVWVGTDNGGLYLFSKPSTSTPYRFVPQQGSIDAISSVTIYCIYEVDPELILMGTFAGGLDVLNDYRHKFFTYNNEGPEGKCLKNKSVLAFEKGPGGKVWMGTDGGGLHLFDPTTHSYQYFNKENGKLPHSNVSKSLFVDSKGRVWVGTYAGGVGIYSHEMKLIKTFSATDLENKIGSDHVWRIVEDKEHNIWLGLLNNGAEKISEDLSRVEHYNFNVKGNNGLKAPEVLSMLVDKKGMLWVISESLHYYDPETNKFKEYSFPGINLPSNLKDLEEDDQGNIWVASSDAAIYKIPPDRGSKPVVFPSKLGWAGNVVLSIQDDDQGNVWMTTDEGISCLLFNQGKLRILNFDIHDGVQTGQFNAAAKMRDEHGYIYFGSSEGYHRFHPKNIKLNNHLPNVSISDIRIFNQPMASFPKYNKSESVFWNDSVLHIDYDDNMISIEFAGLDFVLPEKNQFAYILEGFDKNWNYTRSGAHTATYTNLDPGSYVFKVKAANNDGQWNTDYSKLILIVKPPWWATWWFRVSIAIIFVVSLVSFYFWRTHSIRKRNLELKREVDLQTNELRQINEELHQTTEEVIRQNSQIVRLYNELTESIQAAQVIQHAILPSPEVLKRYFGEIGVMYKPKDVVSGDFYWCAKSGEKQILSVIDCTGHGVAGAFMTFVGYDTLNQIIRENPHADAGQIVTSLNKEIIYAMNQYQTEMIHAGMDVSMCIWESDTNTLQFAGANSPLYIVRGDEVLVIKGDKQGVGGKQRMEDYQFETHRIHLMPGDQIYIFSDGYAGQLGGEKGNDKFMYHRFRQTLLDLRKEKTEIRMGMLEQIFEDWRQGAEQLDDVLVVSFEVK